MIDFSLIQKDLDKIFNISIEDLRHELYKNYSRKQIADKLNVKELQVTRLLNGQSALSFVQFKILLGMIKNE